MIMSYTEETYAQTVNDSFLNPIIEEIHIFLAIFKNMFHLKHGKR